jgi:putative DNA primase/helicase
MNATKQVHVDKLPFTDVGNAQRLVARNGQDLRYCKEWGNWLVWDEVRWVSDTSYAVERQAKTTIRDLYRVAATLEDDDQRVKLSRHAARSESAPRIKNMIEMAKSELGVSVSPDQLDADPWAFNVQNGMLDLQTGRLQSHQREDLITKLSPVAFDPKAVCPTWIAFLDYILGGDEALGRFVQKAVGYSLTGSTQEQCYFILHGSGANGKSTFINTMSALLGGYARHTPTETLLVKNSDAVRNDIARLQGARFVSAVEAEGGRKLAEALVKQLTGGDKVTARYLYQEHFEFVPVFKIWLAVNHKPIIKGADHGTWRRIRLIPFLVTIPAEEQDKSLMDKLKAELPGILRWAVEGCQAWQQEELEPPQAVTQAIDEYRAEMDVVSRFLLERCTRMTGARVGAALLYSTYAGWCSLIGEIAVRIQDFAAALEERGYERGKDKHERYWKSLALKEEAAEMTEPLASYVTRS